MVSVALSPRTRYRFRRSISSFVGTAVPPLRPLLMLSLVPFRLCVREPDRRLWLQTAEQFHHLFRRQRRDRDDRDSDRFIRQIREQSDVADDDRIVGSFWLRLRL